MERYCELANKTTQQLYKVSTPCIDDHHFKEEEIKSVGELSQVCSQIVLKCLYLARIGRPDILWSVNKLARSITKWTKACDKHLNQLISYIHHTCEYKQYCYVGNTAKQCRLGLCRKCHIQKNREHSHSEFSQTVTSKQWRCRKLSETVAGTSANNAGSYARTHEIQTICRQRTDEMDCPTCNVAHFLVSEVARYSPHSIVPWEDRIVENWWNLEKQFSHIFQR